MACLAAAAIALPSLFTDWLFVNLIGGTSFGFGHGY
jgi:hypothetical protein